MSFTEEIEVELEDSFDLENLVSQIRSLDKSLNENMNTSTSNLSNIPNINLTTPEKSELGLLLNALPEFTSNQNLSIFISEVDTLIKHLQGRLTPDLEYIVNTSIRSKIKGDARELIANQSASEWTTIRAALLQKYGEQRSEDLIVNSLQKCVQKRNENYLDFHSRLIKTYSCLMQNINLNITDPNLLAFKRSEYEKLTLKTFNIGLIEPYRSHLSHFNITTIEESLSKCRELDNLRKEWDYCEYLRKTPSSSGEKSSPQNSFNSAYQKPSTMAQFSPRNLNKPFLAKPVLKYDPNNQMFNKFPNFNQLYQNLTQQNKPVFGNKTGSGFFRNSHPAEPMSVQSRINTPPFFRQKGPFQSGLPNSFLQHRGHKPAEEMYNVEQETEYHDPDSTETYEEDPYLCDFFDQQELETQEIETEGNFPTSASQNPES